MRMGMLNDERVAADDKEICDNEETKPQTTVSTFSRRSSVKKIKAAELIKPWPQMKELIHHTLNTADPYDYSITMSHCLEVCHVMKHRGVIRCYSHFTSLSGAQIFIVHYKLGHMEQLTYWKLDTVNQRTTFLCKKFDVINIYSAIIYVKAHRTYVGATPDCTLQLFSDASTNLRERSRQRISSKIFCLVYNDEMEEVVGGSVGRIMSWSFKGLQMGEAPKFQGRYLIDLPHNVWVTHIMVDPDHSELIALAGTYICVINYWFRKQVNVTLTNHRLDMTCCASYFLGGYLFTAGRDMVIKVWNRANFWLTFDFVAHNDVITGLSIHPKEPFLYSCSMDRHVSVWRLDTFQKYMTLPVYEPVHGMRLLDNDFLFVQLESSIQYCNLNQFFNLYDILSSSPLKISRLAFPHSKPKIFVATEDGSLRVMAPNTGETVAMMYPLPSFLVHRNVAYNPILHHIYTIVGHGDILVLNSLENPCRGVERWRMKDHDETITCICHVLAEPSCHEPYIEALLFCGHISGHVSLLKGNQYTMHIRVSAHESPVTHIRDISESWRRRMQARKRVMNYSRLLTAADGVVKIWEVLFDVETRFVEILNTHLLRLRDYPISKLAVIENCVSIIIIGRLKMLQFKLDRIDLSKPDHLKLPKIIFFDRALKRKGSENDHSDKVTALDSCEIASLFVTSSVDGFVKLWDTQNNMIRELSFGRPILSVCFANLRGDLLVGYDKYIMYVSIVKYMPEFILEHILKYNFDTSGDHYDPPIPMQVKDNIDMNQNKLPIHEIHIDHKGRLLWQLATTIITQFTYDDDYDIQAIAEKVLDYYRKSQKPAGKSSVYVDKFGHFKRAARLINAVDKTRLYLRSTTGLSPVSGGSSGLTISSVVDAAIGSDQQLMISEPVSKSACFKDIPQSPLNADFSHQILERDMSIYKPRRDSAVRITKFRSDMDTARKELHASWEKLQRTRSAQPDALSLIASIGSEKPAIPAVKKLSRFKYPVAPDGYIPNSVVRRYFKYKVKRLRKDAKQEKFTLKYLPARLTTTFRVKSLWPAAEFSQPDLREKRRAPAPIKLATWQPTRAPILETKEEMDERNRIKKKKMEDVVEQARRENPMRVKMDSVIARLSGCSWFIRTSNVNTIDAILNDLIKILGSTKDHNIHRYICDLLIEIHTDVGLLRKFIDQIDCYMKIQLKTPEPRIRMNCRELMDTLGLDWKKAFKITGRELKKVAEGSEVQGEVQGEVLGDAALAEMGITLTEEEKQALGFDEEGNFQSEERERWFAAIEQTKQSPFTLTKKIKRRLSHLKKSKPTELVKVESSMMDTKKYVFDDSIFDDDWIDDEPDVPFGKRLVPHVRSSGASRGAAPRSRTSPELVLSYRDELERKKGAWVRQEHRAKIGKKRDQRGKVVSSAGLRLAEMVSDHLDEAMGVLDSDVLKRRGTAVKLQVLEKFKNRLLDLRQERGIVGWTTMSDISEATLISDETIMSSCESQQKRRSSVLSSICSSGIEVIYSEEELKIEDEFDKEDFNKESLENLKKIFADVVKSSDKLSADDVEKLSNAIDEIVCNKDVNGEEIAKMIGGVVSRENVGVNSADGVRQFMGNFLQSTSKMGEKSGTVFSKVLQDDTEKQEAQCLNQLRKHMSEMILGSRRGLGQLEGLSQLANDVTFCRKRLNKTVSIMNVLTEVVSSRDLEFRGLHSVGDLKKLMEDVLEGSSKLGGMTGKIFAEALEGRDEARQIPNVASFNDWKELLNKVLSNRDKLNRHDVQELKSVVESLDKNRDKLSDLGTKTVDELSAVIVGKIGAADKKSDKSLQGVKVMKSVTNFKIYVQGLLTDKGSDFSLPKKTGKLYQPLQAFTMQTRKKSQSHQILHRLQAPPTTYLTLPSDDTPPKAVHKVQGRRKSSAVFAGSPHELTKSHTKKTPPSLKRRPTLGGAVELTDAQKMHNFTDSLVEKLDKLLFKIATKQSVIPDMTAVLSCLRYIGGITKHARSGSLPSSEFFSELIENMKHLQDNVTRIPTDEDSRDKDIIEDDLAMPVLASLSSEELPPTPPQEQIINLNSAEQSDSVKCFLEHLIKQIQSDDEAKRLRALVTVLRLQLTRPIVINAIIPCLADERECVREMAAQCLKVLANISTGKDLADYLDRHWGDFDPQTMQSMMDVASFIQASSMSPLVPASKENIPTLTMSTLRDRLKLTKKSRRSSPSSSQTPSPAPSKAPSSAPSRPSSQASSQARLSSEPRRAVTPTVIIPTIEVQSAPSIHDVSDMDYRRYRDRQSIDGYPADLLDTTRGLPKIIEPLSEVPAEDDIPRAPRPAPGGGSVSIGAILRSPCPSISALGTGTSTPDDERRASIYQAFAGMAVSGRRFTQAADRMEKWFWKEGDFMGAEPVTKDKSLVDIRLDQFTYEPEEPKGGISSRKTSYDKWDERPSLPESTISALFPADDVLSIVGMSRLTATFSSLLSVSESLGPMKSRMESQTTISAREEMRRDILRKMNATRKALRTPKLSGDTNMLLKPYMMEKIRTLSEGSNRRADQPDPTLQLYRTSKLKIPISVSDISDTLTHPAKKVVSLEFEKKTQRSHIWFRKQYDDILQAFRRRNYCDEPLRRFAIRTHSVNPEDLTMIKESGNEMPFKPRLYVSPFDQDMPTRPLTADSTKRRYKTPPLNELESIYKPTPKHEPFLHRIRSGSGETSLDSDTRMSELFNFRNMRRKSTLLSMRSSEDIAELVAKFTSYRTFTPSTDLASKKKTKRRRASKRRFSQLQPINMKEVLAPINTNLSQVVLRGVTVDLKKSTDPYQTLTHYKVNVPAKKVTSKVKQFEYGSNRYGNLSFHWTKGISPPDLTFYKSATYGTKYPLLPAIRPKISVLPVEKPKKGEKLRFIDIAKYWTLPEGMVLEDILPPERPSDENSSMNMESDKLLHEISLS